MVIQELRGPSPELLAYCEAVERTIDIMFELLGIPMVKFYGSIAEELKANEYYLGITVV